MTTEQRLHELLDQLPAADQRTQNYLVSQVLIGIVEHVTSTQTKIIDSVKGLLQAALRTEK